MTRMPEAPRDHRGRGCGHPGRRMHIPRRSDTLDDPHRNRNTCRDGDGDCSRLLPPRRGWRPRPVHRPRRGPSPSPIRPPTRGRAPPRGSSTVLNEEMNESTVVVKLNSRFALELAENPSTGYAWNLTTTDGLRIVSDDLRRARHRHEGRRRRGDAPLGDRSDRRGPPGDRRRVPALVGEHDLRREHVHGRDLSRGLTRPPWRPGAPGGGILSLFGSPRPGAGAGRVIRPGADHRPRAGGGTGDRPRALRRGDAPPSRRARPGRLEATSPLPARPVPARDAASPRRGLHHRYGPACARNIRAYRPPIAMSSACVPRSTTSPRSKT